MSGKLAQRGDCEYTLNDSGLPRCQSQHGVAFKTNISPTCKKASKAFKNFVTEMLWKREKEELYFLSRWNINSLCLSLFAAFSFSPLLQQHLLELQPAIWVHFSPFYLHLPDLYVLQGRALDPLQHKTIKSCSVPSSLSAVPIMWISTTRSGSFHFLGPIIWILLVVFWW